MQILNWYKGFIQQFAEVYLIILAGLSLITILFSLLVKKNKKSKLMLQILIISCVTLWIILISSLVFYFSTDQLTGVSQYDKMILKDIMFYVTYAPMLFCFPLLYVHIVLQRIDKNSTGLWIVDLLIKSILIYEILLFLPHYTIIMRM